MCVYISIRHNHLLFRIAVMWYVIYADKWNHFLYSECSHKSPPQWMYTYIQACVGQFQSGQYICNFADLVLSVQFLDLPSPHTHCHMWLQVSKVAHIHWETRMNGQALLSHLVYSPLGVRIYVMCTYVSQALWRVCQHVVRIAVMWYGRFKSLLITWMLILKPTTMDVYIQTRVGQFLTCVVVSIQSAHLAHWIQFL